MKNIKDYIVMQIPDKYSRSPIPKTWFINESKFTFGVINLDEKVLILHYNKIQDTRFKEELY